MVPKYKSRGAGYSDMPCTYRNCVLIANMITYYFLYLFYFVTSYYKCLTMSSLQFKLYPSMPVSEEELIL